MDTTREDANVAHFQPYGRTRFRFMIAADYADQLFTAGLGYPHRTGQTSLDRLTLVGREVVTRFTKKATRSVRCI